MNEYLDLCESMAVVRSNHNSSKLVLPSTLVDLSVWQKHPLGAKIRLWTLTDCRHQMSQNWPDAIYLSTSTDIASPQCWSFRWTGFVKISSSFCYRLLGIFWKCARIGERKSPWVGFCCVAMAFSIIFLSWHQILWTVYCIEHRIFGESQEGPRNSSTQCGLAAVLPNKGQ